MASGGRGRGRGGFGGGSRYAKQLPYELFPEIENDKLGKASKQQYESANRQLIKWSASLQSFWRSSPYYYEDRNNREAIAEVQKTDIERYSDRSLEKRKANQQLADVISLSTDYFPAELARGERKGKHVSKKVRWNPESGSKKIDILENLELKNPGEGEEKKDEEDEEEENEEDEEFSDEGDYEENEHFDDDEDDFNDVDGNDEASY